MFNFGNRSIRARLAGSAGMLALMTGAALAQSGDFALPSQPLAESLKDIAQKTGQNILFSPQAVAGVRAPAVSGEMSGKDAVARLLSGTDLEVTSDGGDGLVVRRTQIGDKRGDAGQPARIQMASLSTSDSLNLPPSEGASPIVVAQNSPPPASPAAAPAPEANGNNAETVVVSASRISIAGYTAPTPVTTVSASSLTSQANLNLGASLRELPSMGNVLTPEQGSNAASSNSGALGISNVNLRNMGSNRTLVLFNGQRAVSPIVSGGQDLSVIPVNMIQRVDVVTGGASASWGSDAVSGVVNVIINKNFTGFKASIQGASMAWGQSYSYGGDVAYGFDALGDRAHVQVAASVNISPNTVFLGKMPWYQGKGLFQNPAWTAGSTTVPKYIPMYHTGSCATPGGAILSGPLAGTQFGPGGKPMPYNPGTGLPYSVCVGGSSNTYNSGFADLPQTTPMTQQAALAYASYKVTPDITAGLMLNYARNYIESTSETILKKDIPISINNPYLDPSIVTAMQANGISSFNLASNFLDGVNLQDPNWNQFANSVGQPQSISTRQFYRGVFTLDGAIGDNWSWSAAGQWSTERIHQVDVSDALTSRIYEAANAVRVTAANVGTSGLPIGSIQCASVLAGPSDGCVPYDVLGTGVQDPAAVHYIAGSEPDWMFENLDQVTFDASMQGTLPGFDFTGAGAPAVAFGADYRKEAGRETVNYYATHVLFGAGNFQPFVGEYNVWEGYGEVTLPLIKNGLVQSLEGNAAGRITDYSTSGMVETWKLGFTSQVNDDVRLRGTWSYDIRAPNLGDLFATVTVSGSHVLPGGVVDPAAFTIQGGNPNLKPETAGTWEAGVVLTPHWIPGLQASLDWYSIDLKGYMASPPATLEAQLCDQGNQTYCSYFFKVGGIEHIIDTEQNSGYLTTSGLDFQLDYPMDFLEGTLNWHLMGNYTNEITRSLFGQPPFNGAGTEGLGAPYSGLPKLHVTLAANYVQGPWNLTVEGRLVGSSTLTSAWNADQPCALVGAVLSGFCWSADENRVPAVAYLNLRASYNWNENIQLYTAIDNALGIPPPWTGELADLGMNTDSYGTDESQYRILGRVIQAGVRFSF